MTFLIYLTIFTVSLQYYNLYRNFNLLNIIILTLFYKKDLLLLLFSFLIIVI